MIEKNVDELLNKLESQITLAKKGFMSDLKMVDESVCLECISDIRNLLPSELSDARRIKKDVQNITANAENNASRIIADAQMEAQRLVNESKIVNDAKMEADRIIQDATNYANGLVGQAYANMASLFNDCELHARDILQVIMQTKAQVFPTCDQNDNNNLNNQQQ